MTAKIPFYCWRDEWYPVFVECDEEEVASGEYKPDMVEESIVIRYRKAKAEFEQALDEMDRALDESQWRQEFMQAKPGEVVRTGSRS